MGRLLFKNSGTQKLKTYIYIVSCSYVRHMDVKAKYIY